MTEKEVLAKLKKDEHYYGAFGKKYLSNSDISTLLENPLALKEPSKTNAHFLVGGYFHTAILEPDKLKNFKVVEASSRNTKHYKEITGGEMCLLQHEVDMTEALVSKMIDNEVCRSLIHEDKNEFELPGITELYNQMWKGKADIVNHDEKLIIDLKTTADLTKFKYSASKYNYDSQAFIYSSLFGYEFMFIVIDKKTHQIGIYDCSPQFYETGQNKVKRACEAYDLFYKTDSFDPKQYFISKTL